MTRSTRLSTPLGKDAHGDPILTFRQIEGQAQVNQLFRYELIAHSLRDDLDPGQLIGHDLTLSLDDQFHEARYLNAVVQDVEWIGSDENYQLYRLTLAPWLMLAGLRHDCRIFQHKSVPAIVDDVLQFYSYPIKKRLAASYPQREYCVQYNESDLAFVCRLLEEEGISYYFQHEDGRHSLVLDDFLQNPATVSRHATLPFRTTENSHANASESLFEWQNRDHIVSGRFATSDYWFQTPSLSLLKNSLESRHKDAAHFEIFHWPGNHTQAGEGERITRIRLEQQQQGMQRMHSKTNVRALAFSACGAMFTLSEHPHAPMNNDYLILGTQLFLKENPSASNASASAPEWRISLQFQPASLPLRPAMLTPHPHIGGIQSARVVGMAGQEVWTNEYGQVKLHFDWDRYSPQNEKSSCWVRVASSWAGSNWGEVMIPRIGQEVLVAFVDGDPDYPMVVGRVNNADKMPTSFSHRGSLPANQVLSGVKSKEFSGNRYNQLLFDDTSGQIRTQLESEHDKTQLNLGFLTEPRQGSNAAPRGEGFELRTDGWGVLRGQHGILITSASQPQGAGNAMARQDLTIGIDEAHDQAKAQADYAKAHQALAGDQAPQKTLAKAVKEWGHGSNVEKEGSGGAPIVAVNAPAGIAMFTPLSSTHAAAHHLDFVAGKNQQLSAGATMHLHAGMGMSLFAQSGGVRSIAHEGKHIIQAQQDDIQIQADQSVQITASHNHVLVAADKHITLMCGGAYIKLAGGNIEIHAPGTIDMKAANYTMQGPTSGKATLPQFEKGDAGRKFKLHFAGATQVVANRAFKVALKDGRVIEGKTDEDGETDLLKEDLPHIANIDIEPHHE